VRWVRALAGTALNRPASDAADYILAGIAELGVHPDVPEGVRILRQHGLRPVTLTNGSASVADRLPCPGYLAAPNLRAPGLVALAGQIVT